MLASAYSFHQRYPSLVDVDHDYSGSIFNDYFNCKFDCDRFISDRALGGAARFDDYYEADVEGCLDKIRGLSLVIDFDNLEKSLKYLVEREELYPFSYIPKSRGYIYDKDSAKEFALKYLDHRDVIIYEEILKSENFINNFSCNYKKYRSKFALEFGLNLETGDTISYEIYKPLGLGWYDVEKIEKDVLMRWSEPKFSIELPIVRAGNYIVRVKISHVGSSLKIHSTCNYGNIRIERCGYNELDFFEELVIFYNCSCSGWMDVYFDCEQFIVTDSKDLRELGLVVYSISVEKVH